MDNISTFVEQVITVQRPSAKNQIDEDLEIIPSNRKNDHITVEKIDIFEKNKYISFVLTFFDIIHILSSIETSHGRQNINLVYEHVHFSSLQS
jgi:hypothetical protein